MAQCYIRRWRLRKVWWNFKFSLGLIWLCHNRRCLTRQIVTGICFSWQSNQKVFSLFGVLVSSAPLNWVLQALWIRVFPMVTFRRFLGVSGPSNCSIRGMVSHSLVPQWYQRSPWTRVCYHCYHLFVPLQALSLDAVWSCLRNLEEPQQVMVKASRRWCLPDVNVDLSKLLVVSVRIGGLELESL